MTPADELRRLADEAEADAYLVRWTDPNACRRLRNVAAEMRDLAERLPPHPRAQEDR